MPYPQVPGPSILSVYRCYLEHQHHRMNPQTKFPGPWCWTRLHGSRAGIEELDGISWETPVVSVLSTHWVKAKCSHCIIWGCTSQLRHPCSCLLMLWLSKRTEQGLRQQAEVATLDGHRQPHSSHTDHPQQGPKADSHVVPTWCTCYTAHNALCSCMEVSGGMQHVFSEWSVGNRDSISTA